MTPVPVIQEALDTALERAPDRAKAQFALLVGEVYSDVNAHVLSSGPATPGQPSQSIPTDDIDALLIQLMATSISDDAIQQIEQATVALAESHTQTPAHKLLSQVIPLHRHVQSLLQGKYRLAQQRELYRIESLLLSHACLLLGDLNQNALAERYGDAGLAYAREAGSDQAVAMTALAKTLRWQERLTESMTMAQKGFDFSPNTPIRIQLASQESNAAALLGDVARAREALARAEHAAETTTSDSGQSAWSFPVARQAIFALSVETQIGDTDRMLQAAFMADAAWSAGALRSTANWAQIRVGASTAYLMKGALDETISEVAPVLALPPSLRVATVTAYTERLGRQLRNPRYNKAVGVRELREQLAQFNAGALQETDS